MSSASGSPKKPPTSAPDHVKPLTPSVSVIGTLTRKWSQSAALSPVHTGPTRCEPAKNARDNTSGRSFRRARKPWAVAAW